MPSQFFGLNISYTGLMTSNAALNTTSNNIANSDTEGYSRQQTIQQACRALQTFTTYGCAGAGVDTIAIERVRDEFYDVKYWNNNEQLGTETAKAYYMETIENYVNDTEKSGGFNTAFDLMYNALEELAKNSGDTSTKSQFITYAQSLCDYFNSISNELKELQKDVNMEVKDTVSEINSIAEQIATLNKQINVTELTGATANELRDQRTLLIDQLSLLTSVETIETPIYDTNNNYDTGANRYQVLIAGGQTLVDTNAYNTLECVPRETNETINQSDTLGLYDIRWSNGNTFSIYSPMVGGKLQGLIEMRDGNNMENFHGTVESVDTVNNTIKIDVTEDYLKDLNKCTLSSSGGVIKLGTETYYYTDWTYSLNTDTGKCTYTLQLDSNYGECTLSNSRINKDAIIGKAIDYQGIPYYQEQLNEFVRLYAEKFNEIITQDGAVDGNGDAATILFKGTDVLGTQYDFDDYYTMMDAIEAGSTNTITLSNTDDSYYRLTANDFVISKTISSDPDLLATRTGASDGESKGDVAEDLIDMKTDSSILSFRGGSASEFLQNILSDVALNASRVNNSQKYYTTMKTTITNQRTSISGVDPDEEAVSLVKYQNSYNLASKMISTFTEIYDRLILETGV